MANNANNSPYGPLIQFDTEDKLDELGVNYDAWVAAMEIALTSRELYEVAVEGDTVQPEAPPGQVTQWRKRNNLAIAQIGMNVNMALLNQLDRTTAHSLYTSIKTRFEQKSPIAHALASRNLRSKVIKESETMTEHIKELRIRRTKFVSTGGVLAAAEWRSVIVNSLAGKWNTYPAALTGVEEPEKVINAL